MKAGYLQYTPMLGEIRKNAENILEFIKSHKPDEKIDLLVLPEMILTGYAFPDKASLSRVCSEEFNDFTLAFCKEVSSVTGGYTVAGYPEFKNGLFFNSAMLTDKTTLVGNYQKSHLFGLEKDVFEPGESGFKVFSTPDFNVGIMICFDWVFPESARTLALSGADIIAHPVNLVMPYCQRAMFARSLENGVFTISANRCGTENWGSPLTFTGESIIYDPRGEMLARGPLDGQELKIVDMDISKAANKNLNSVNHLFKNRRTDLYYSV
ncbi:MAG: acyltransferase [Deltaproteobacteria bacterium]|nr:acyltransferase [Deltaproteobacteria bacterium]